MIPARYNITKLAGKLHPRSPIRLWLQNNREATEGAAAALFHALTESTNASAWAARVRERAAAVLPTLIARREHKESVSSPLRPSAVYPMEHLVRPVYNPDPDLTNLLRASNSETPDAAVHSESGKG
ncbi:MAG: hypothetical protein JWN14_2652 [Chthonomonadales bacterium]|nr:hypothetical protein [Chthonomonadales bacterium]